MREKNFFFANLIGFKLNLQHDISLANLLNQINSCEIELLTYLVLKLNYVVLNCVLRRIFYCGNCDTLYK